MWVLNISCARFEKYRSKLHIFRSLVANLRFARIYPALALKNIEVNFIFFARLLLYLQLVYWFQGTKKERRQ